MTLLLKPKTSSAILKILIQNQVKAGEYYIGTCRGEDASIASLQGIPKPYQLDDLMLGSIFSQPGKCICFMGGRMQFAPTIWYTIMEV